MKFHCVASGDWETEDGRFRVWRIPGVNPPAWNVEDTSDFSVIVDGAASMKDAIAIFRDDQQRKDSR